MRTAKGDAYAADDGNPPSLLIPHATLRSNAGTQYKGPRVRYGVVFLRQKALYNRRMKPLSPAGALAMALFAGCGAADDPETEIRALLAAAEEAAEARDTGFFGDLVGDGYRDAQGNDREQLLRMVRGYFIANQRIEIVSRVDEVVLEGADAARAVVHAGMAGQRSGGDLFAGVNADLYRFELELVRSGGDWHIIGADWQRALGD